MECFVLQSSPPAETTQPVALSSTTYLRIATLTVAYRRQPTEFFKNGEPRVTVLMPVAPYGGTAYFLLRGDEITPVHAGDWDDEITDSADAAIGRIHRRARRPYGRLDN